MGDSETGGVVRDEGREKILASDPRWKHLVAMSMADLRDMLRTYGLGCEKWRNESRMQTADEVVARAIRQ